MILPLGAMRGCNPPAGLSGRGRQPSSPVAAGGRGRAALDATSAEIAANGVKLHAAVCDLADKDAIAAYIAAATVLMADLLIVRTKSSGFGLLIVASGVPVYLLRKRSRAEC